MTAQLISLIFIGLAGVVLGVYSLGHRPMQPAVVKRRAHRPR